VQRCQKGLKLPPDDQLRKHAPVIEPSHLIPKEQRDWVCPSCQRVLRLLSCQHEKSVTHPYATARKRKEVTLNPAQDLLFRVYRRDKGSRPSNRH